MFKVTKKMTSRQARCGSSGGLLICIYLLLIMSKYICDLWLGHQQSSIKYVIRTTNIFVVS